MRIFFILNTIALVISQDIYPQISNPFEGSITGNAQLDFQFYRDDEAIDAPPVPERVLSNSFLNVIYQGNNFYAGIRYEAYLPKPILGFDNRFAGQGIPFRYAGFKNEYIDLTAGNFYDQFGVGLIFRSYEERSLGFDNAIDGFRVVYSPHSGVRLKALAGKQRFFWNLGAGTIRAADVEFSINEFFEGLKESKTQMMFGVSFVSKYQDDQDVIVNDDGVPVKLIIPLNVGSYGGRFQLSRGKLVWYGEGVYKINDPSFTNNFIYRHGSALMSSISYSQKGLGITFSGKRVDNMDFRSDRNEIGNNLLINFIPMLNRQHTYNLAATIYPYAFQPLGELGYQADVTYKLKKGTKLGGKYGTELALNYSVVNGLNTTETGDRFGYRADFFIPGGLYYRDINIEITRKLDKKWKLAMMYMNLRLDNSVLLLSPLSGVGIINANIGVIDLNYRLNDNNNIRFESQILVTQEDQGSWLMGLVEYTISPKWFFTVMNQYNYGNPDEEKQLHYPLVAAGYNTGKHRFSLSAGRQRAGVICIGGVCRTVPAANGVMLTVLSSF